MAQAPFRCYLVTRDEQKKVQRAITEQPLDALPEGDVLIRVAYSSLNYKDGLGATGHPGVARNFPHVPGIDAAGTVEQSDDPRHKPGDPVLVTGFDQGAGRWGGYSQYVRAPADWVVPLPAGLSLRDSMLFGTAGLTAAMSVEALRHHDVLPESGPVLVTGASGGVGCIAVAILAHLGYEVVAASGKADAESWLRELGAREIVGRDAVRDDSGRPLLSSRWAGAVDTVGGDILATVLRTTNTGGCVTACGMVAGNDLNVSVFPFILRGVSLIGIDSATYSLERRTALWNQMAGDWRPQDLEKVHTATVPLDGLDEQIEKILAGGIRGRVVVEIGDA